MSQNYKDTLNLPRTDFPMKANLAQREPELLKKWEETCVYQQIQKARANAEVFVLHDGPPFANGDVHMGTALNKILKDFVVKSQTMLGKRAPYVPGWDCHGLPIEYKVVKESRDLAPLEVRKRCEAFARKFIDIQREQFKRLGVFGDWEHPYLTMDPKYEAEILRAFAIFVEKGLVYQSMKPVFWSTGAQTALAEAEVEYQERDDTAVFVKFPIISGALKDKASIAIWTTTPWTLPANLLIAVHPKEIYVVQEFTGPTVGGASASRTETLVLADKLVPQFCAATGFQPTGEPMQSFPGDKLEGIGAQHPFLPRTAMVLPAEFVTMDTGTGAVHIAPGHGEDDYLLVINAGTREKDFAWVRDHTGQFNCKVENLSDDFTQIAIQGPKGIGLLQKLTDADLALRGEHPEFGAVTLRQLLATWVAHDLGHIAQIARVMAKRHSEAVGPFYQYLSILLDGVAARDGKDGHA